MGFLAWTSSDYRGLGIATQLYTETMRHVGNVPKPPKHLLMDIIDGTPPPPNFLLPPTDLQYPRVSEHPTAIFFQFTWK